MSYETKPSFYICRVCGELHWRVYGHPEHHPDWEPFSLIRIKETYPRDTIHGVTLEYYEAYLRAKSEATEKP